MRMITASFTRVLQRCAGHLCMHFLAIFQELSRVSKTCNQLIDTFCDSVAVILQEELGAKGGRRNEHVETDTRIGLGVQVN